MTQKVFTFEWPDDLGPEWLNKESLENLVYSPHQGVALSIPIKITDVTDIPEDVEELNKVVIGALSDFADYASEETGHRREHLYKLVDRFIDWKMIKHTGGHSDWHLQCVSNTPPVPEGI